MCEKIEKIRSDQVYICSWYISTLKGKSYEYKEQLPSLDIFKVLAEKAQKFIEEVVLEKEKPEQKICIDTKLDTETKQMLLAFLKERNHCFA